MKPTSGVVVANVHWKLNRCSSSAGAGRLEVTQGACSKLEHSADVRVSNLRQYLEALGVPAVGCRSTSAATTQPDQPLSAPCQHDSHPPVQTSVVTPLGSHPVQQPYNTTSTNGLLLAPTTALLGGPDPLVHQGERR